MCEIYVCILLIIVENVNDINKNNGLLTDYAIMCENLFEFFLEIF